MQKFDARLLKPGQNSVTFTVPAGDVTTGVVWDYVRLELNDGNRPTPSHLTAVVPMSPFAQTQPPPRADLKLERLLSCMSSFKVTRRKFIGNSTFVALGLPVVLGRTYSAFAAPSPVDPYVPPRSPRATLNFNYDWRFIREGIPGAEVPAFDDAKWATVATPHSFNDVDSFRNIISHSGGDTGTYKGLAWYRKHFKLPGRP